MLSEFTRELNKNRVELIHYCRELLGAHGKRLLKNPSRSNKVKLKHVTIDAFTRAANNFGNNCAKRNQHQRKTFCEPKRTHKGSLKWRPVQHKCVSFVPSSCRDYIKKVFALLFKVCSESLQSGTWIARLEFHAVRVRTPLQSKKNGELL